MQQSNEINELAKALSLAQADIEGAVKDATNPFFKSKYADLSSVIQAIKAPLAAHGLSVTQLTDFNEDRIFVETQISHISGQWMRGRFPIFMKDDSPQALGSGTSYSRRYALQAALSVSSIDDDAQTAQVPQSQARAPQKIKETNPLATGGSFGPEPPPIESSLSDPMTPAQCARVMAIAKECGWNSLDVTSHANARFKVNKWEHVAFKDHDLLCKYIQNNPRKK